jgi:hypothetical protein
MDNRSQILPRIAIALVVVVILLGILFLVLDILDIDEDFRLGGSIPAINTILISAIGLITLIFATRNFLKSGSFVILGLSGSVLAFGFSVFLYSWLPATGLDIRMMLYDSGALFTSVLHLSAAMLGVVKPGLVYQESGSRIIVIIYLYLGVLLIVGIITWLGYQGIITYSTRILAGYLTSRDVVQGIGAVFCVISALIYLNRYRRRRHGMYFWYSLGLIMMAAGFFFVLRGFLASRVAWMGRVALYLGGIYFLVAVWPSTGDTIECATD